MARLVDADELKNHLFVGAVLDKTINYGIARTEEEVFAFRCGWNDALKSVAQFAPTVDAVEVVRCKDCKYWRNNDCQNDSHGYCPINENDFCSRGERREDGKTD